MILDLLTFGSSSRDQDRICLQAIVVLLVVLVALQASKQVWP